VHEGVGQHWGKEPVCLPLLNRSPNCVRSCAYWVESRTQVALVETKQFSTFPA
jgi:hypothetical protein